MLMIRNMNFPLRLAVLVLVLIYGTSLVQSRIHGNHHQKLSGFAAEDSISESNDESTHNITSRAESTIPFSVAHTVDHQGIESLQKDRNTVKDRNLSSCVKTETQLRNAVKAAPNGKDTTITLCRVTISLSLHSNSKLTGIDITNKIINLRCNLSSNKRCNLDGAHRSRIFFGCNATLSATKINFMNGNTEIGNCFSCEKNGGALLFKKNSTLHLDRTSFTNNNCDNVNGDRGYGGAIFLDGSTLFLSGGSSPADGSVFDMNNAFAGGAIYAKSSSISTEKGYVIFKNNTSLYGAAVDVHDCPRVVLKQTNFYQNVAEFGASALGSDNSSLTLHNVKIVNNTHDGDGALSLLGSKATLTNVSFINNHALMQNGAGLYVFHSKADLTSCLFDRNVVPKGELGADIEIYSYGGATSTVSCLANNNVFCSGLSNSSIDGADYTNCETTGIAGTPGVGRCQS